MTNTKVNNRVIRLKQQNDKLAKK